MVMIKRNIFWLTLWRYFTDKEIKIRLSLIVLFFRFVILRLVFLGSLVLEGVSGSPETSMMELFPTLVNYYLLITNVARICLGCREGCRPASVTEVLFFRLIFSNVLVSEFPLNIELLWQCTFNTANTLLLNENLYMYVHFIHSLIMSCNGIFFKTCLSTFMLKLSWESIHNLIFIHA